MTPTEFDDAFLPLRGPLQGYLFRLSGSHADAEDLCQDTWMRARRGLKSFEARSSLKAWVFRIATNLARDHHRVSSRWPVEAQDRGRDAATGSAEPYQAFVKDLAQGRFEAREHIDYCFTCISRSLPLEEQLVVLLKDVFQFRNREVAGIVGHSEPKTKHLLHQGRSTLRRVFDDRCSLINRNGVCHQCSELAGTVNPARDHAHALAALELVKAADEPRTRDLLALRTALVRSVDPTAPTTPLQGTFLEKLHEMMGT